jgi:hypothetical protein
MVSMSAVSPSLFSFIPSFVHLGCHFRSILANRPKKSETSIPFIRHGMTRWSISSFSQNGRTEPRSLTSKLSADLTDAMAPVRALTPSNPAPYLNKVSIVWRFDNIDNVCVTARPPRARFHPGQLGHKLDLPSSVVHQARDRSEHRAPHRAGGVSSENWDFGTNLSFVISRVGSRYPWLGDAPPSLQSDLDSQSFQ